MGSAVITLRRMGAYLRAHGVDDWAEYIEALPPEGEEARAFARSQAELGSPDPFKPRTDRGLFMRKNLPGFAPNPRALSVLVTLEGLREHDDEPRSPEDIESRLVPAAWEQWEPVPDGVRVTWTSGLLPLERVEVAETAAHVTITLWERHPPRFREDGSPSLPHAVRMARSAEIALEAPVGERRVMNGATGVEIRRSDFPSQSQDTGAAPQ
jgi:hypothetical protein